MAQAEINLRGATISSCIEAALVCASAMMEGLRYDALGADSAVAASGTQADNNFFDTAFKLADHIRHCAPHHRSLPSVFAAGT